MREISNQFIALKNKLRETVPFPMDEKHGKLTKVEILHIAINHIPAYKRLLAGEDYGYASFSELKRKPFDEKSYDTYQR